jgi:tartrate-resistant acid phosphatase type 5
MRHRRVSPASVGFALCLALTAAHADKLTIGVIGDYGGAMVSSLYYTGEVQVSTLVKSWNPDFVMTTGDNNYTLGSASTIDANVGQFYHEFIYPYKGAYGAGATSNRFFPVLGNHDYYASPTAQPYLDYFTLPGNGRYYSYRCGNVEIFALDSEAPEPDGITSDSLQAQWLRQGLANSQAPWRLVSFHTPPYSSGVMHGSYTGEGLHMRWPFKEWGAAAVLSGHEHFYERFNTNGFVYFINGLGGYTRYQFTDPRLPGSEAAYNNDWGAQRITVTETNLTFEFINVSGELVDTYTLTNVPTWLSLNVRTDAVEVTAVGFPGATYVLDASADLTNWVPVATNTSPTAAAVLVDAAPPAAAARFYRVRR